MIDLPQDVIKYVLFPFTPEALLFLPATETTLDFVMKDKKSYSTKDFKNRKFHWGRTHTTPSLFAAIGHLPLLELYICKKLPFRIESLITWAIIRNQLSVLKWLHSKKLIPKRRGTYFNTAAQYGHFNIIQWMNDTNDNYNWLPWGCCRPFIGYGCAPKIDKWITEKQVEWDKAHPRPPPPPPQIKIGIVTIPIAPNRWGTFKVTYV
jgi:hypothetical protein